RGRLHADAGRAERRPRPGRRRPRLRARARPQPLRGRRRPAPGRSRGEAALPRRLTGWRARHLRVYGRRRMRPRRRVCVMVVAVLAALVALLQLPGPATCPKLSWRWVALALDALELEPPAELTEAAAGDTEAVAP